MKAFWAGVIVAVGIAAIAAIISNVVDLSAADTYQSPYGSVRL